LKKRKIHSSFEVKTNYHLPQEVKGQKEFLTATHQRKVYQLPISRKYIPKLPNTEVERAEAIREITVQWYGPYEAFGPMKGLEKIREQFLQQELNLKITWSRYIPKSPVIRGVTIQGMKIDIISAMMVIKEWMDQPNKIEEWRRNTYEGLKLMAKKIPDFSIPEDVTNILDLDCSMVKEIKQG
ncbi:unnamed protein product, partial [Allacma fusca]